MQVEWVRYGRPAADALRSAVTVAKDGDPLAPVSVVVPSNHVGVATRRLLASGQLGPVCERGTGLIAVSFATPYRLAELLGAASLAATGRKPVSTPVIAAAVRTALTEHPGVFAPVADHPATETALVSAYRELRDLSSEALDWVSANSPRAADVVRLHRRARAHLEHDWYDEQDLMVAAATVLDAEPNRNEGELGTVLVYLPQELSRYAGAFLAAVATVAPLTVVAGLTGDRAADAAVATAVSRITGAETPLPPIAPEPTTDVDRTQILTASDADDEVRAAVRAVVDATRAGTPLDRIAILHASPEPYARLVHEHLGAAGIPANGAAVVPVAARLAGRSLLGWLTLPSTGFRREEVFGWLVGAPVLLDGRMAPTARWERISRDAGVVAGREQWDRLLQSFADRCQARAAQAEAEPDRGDQAARHRRDEADARDLRRFVLTTIDDLASAANTPRGWDHHARWARHQLRALLGEGWRHQHWPPAERRAVERLEIALDRLAALATVEGPVPLDVFSRTLGLELENDLGRVGRFGEGVLVGPVGLGIGLDLDVVVVLGMAEGSFPAPMRDDALLPDHERHAARGELIPRSERLPRQHRQLLAALAGARRHQLSFPRGDLRRSSDRLPSRWLLDTAGQLAGARWWSSDLLATSTPWLHHLGSFDQSLRHLDFPSTTQEHRLRSLLAVSPAESSLDAEAEPIVSLGRAAVRARRSSTFTRFDGNVGGLAVPSPASTPTSATRLEQWADCPYAYFLRQVLRIEPVENPEDELQITPADRGTLVHEVLERFITARLRSDGAPDPQQPWSEDDAARLLAEAETVFADFQGRGLTGRAIFWERDRRRIVADLLTFLAADSRHRAAHRTRPLAAELSFGMRDSATDAVPLFLADGRAVLFAGKADRIDLADDGALHVIDYKTGGSRGYVDLSEDNPDVRGTKLQLAVYGQAARQFRDQPDAAVRSEYWFISTKGQFERIGYPVTEKVLRLVGETLTRMVTGIESGIFPPHPTATSTTPSWIQCPYCDPDGLGSTELRRQWDRKRHDIGLAQYADLAEPLDAVDVDVDEVTRG